MRHAHNDIPMAVVRFYGTTHRDKRTGINSGISSLADSIIDYK